MRRFFKTVFLSSLCVLALGFHAFASDLAFFTAIPDIPLKPGLVELSEQTLTFDKPQGRIIEAIAEIQDGSEDDIRLYYRQSLPQLGWEFVSKGIYDRKQEQLRFTFEDYGDSRFLRVMLEPR